MQRLRSFLTQCARRSAVRTVRTARAIPRAAAPAVAVAVAVAALLALGAAPARAQAGVLRGTVTDSAGRPLAGVQVISINSKRETRTDREGRFTLAKLPFGQQLIMARFPGYQPADRAVNMLDSTMAEVSFRLRRVVQALDTLRIVSHDGCAAYDWAGFDCRRRAGIGQFRGPEELGALRSYYWADMFEGMPGLRREAIRDPIIGQDWDVASTTGWRCLMAGWNGREKTSDLENVRPDQIVAIEHYDTYEKVPAAYKRLAWPNGQDKPCALVIYWTRGYFEKLGQQPPRR
ncbi:MAG: carboxypeptidase-like regulatory domain-containing protein [Gemmatimonadaceae bacterium]|nr:carboxypeptidase-like regulatory domain-containing protein [Gemmatimonadaceae bacterium]